MAGTVKVNAISQRVAAFNQVSEGPLSPQVEQQRLMQQRRAMQPGTMRGTAVPIKWQPPRGPSPPAPLSNPQKPQDKPVIPPKPLVSNPTPAVTAATKGKPESSPAQVPPPPTVVNNNHNKVAFVEKVEATIAAVEVLPEPDVGHPNEADAEAVPEASAHSPQSPEVEPRVEHGHSASCSDEWEPVTEEVMECKVRCLWDWKGTNHDDLELIVDQLVTLQNWDDPDWWYGFHKGKAGWFPANYVEVLDTAEAEQQVYEPRKLTQEETLARVVDEIVSTEKEYLKSLQVVIEGYKRKMELLEVPREHITTLFGNIEDIHAFHSGFSQQLENASQNNTLPQAFYREKNNFKMYAQYCTNHPKATALLDQYNKQPNMKAFFMGCRLLIEQDIPLQGFLLTPIQRICKYPLLFKEMLKYTPETSPSHSEVRKALEASMEAASYVNEIQRAKENRRLLSDLQSRIEGWEGPDIMATNAELLLEAALNKISGGKSQDRQFFLFDKILVYCKENSMKKKHYLFKGRIPLNKLIIKDLPDNPSRNHHVMHGIQLDRYDFPTPKMYVVCCSSEKEKARWMQAIRSAQDKLDFKPEELLASLSQRKDAKPKKTPPQVERKPSAGMPPPNPPKQRKSVAPELALMPPPQERPSSMISEPSSKGLNARDAPQISTSPLRGGPSLTRVATPLTSAPKLADEGGNSNKSSQDNEAAQSSLSSVSVSNTSTPSGPTTESKVGNARRVFGAAATYQKPQSKTPAAPAPAPDALTTELPIKPSEARKVWGFQAKKK